MENNNINPLVSVIVPVYNVEKYIHECVYSIMDQTYNNLEIILVDDGSPDSCPKICDDLVEMDLRIKVVHKQNEGLGFARNSGLDIATGEYVLFVDSDDYLVENAIETLVGPAVKEGYFYVKAAYKKVNDNGDVLYCKNQEAKSFDKDGVECELRPRMLGSSPTLSDSIEMSVWATLYCRRIIESLKLRFDSERVIVSEDLPFNLAYLSCCEKALLLSDKIYCYRSNPESLTQKYEPNKFDRIIYMFDQIQERFPQLICHEFVRFSRLYFVFLRRYIKFEANKPNSSVSEKVRGIDNLIQKKKTISIVKDYPIEQLPFKQRIFVHLIKQQNAVILYLLSKFRLM